MDWSRHSRRIISISKRTRNSSFITYEPTFVTEYIQIFADRGEHVPESLRW